MKLAVMWGLTGGAGIALADDAELPELEFLEYLGSWEESDEDWVLLAEEADTRVASKGAGDDPVPPGEDELAELDQVKRDLAELDDES